MYSLDRLIHHHFRGSGLKKKPTGMQALMFNYPVFQLAMGMMASFGVLFVYQLGVSLVSGLGLVLLFFGLQRLVVVLMSPVVAKLILKIGYRWTVFVSLFAMIAKTFILIQVSEVNWWLLGTALLFGGTGIASYYISYHGLFLTDNDDDKIGQQMGLVTMVGRMGVMIAPLIAGLLIENFSYNTMFFVAIGLLLLSSLPLFLMPHHDHGKERFDLKDSVKLLTKKSGFLDSAMWWHFENGLQSFFWPILLFSLVGSFAKFGVIGSMVMLANGAAVFVAGKIYDKRKLRRGYSFFAVMVALSNVLRYSSKSLLRGVLSDGFNRLVSPFWWMKIRRNSLMDGERCEPMVFAVAWEWSACLGYLSALVVGYLILVFSGGRWELLMIPAVVANVISAVGVRKDEGAFAP